jgi:phosphatidylglycerol:prolipoprotein diacylglycerol transferase
MINFPNLGIKIDIDRVLFSLGGLDIYWYGLLVTGGILLALIFAIKNAPKFGVLSDDIFDIGFAGAIVGIIGARFYYVLFNIADYNVYTAIFGIRDGGLAIYGGIIFGVVTAIIISFAKRVKFTAVLDLVSFGFLIGQGIGRWGNFFNQEAYGSYTNLPWAMSGSNIPTVEGFDGVHPCFLYESLWCFLGLGLLLLYKRRRTFDGELFCLYMVWYGIARFFIEGLRTDSLYLGDFKISQIVSAIAVILGITIFITNKAKKGNILYSVANADYIANYPERQRIKDEQDSAAKALKREMDNITKG